MPSATTLGYYWANFYDTVSNEDGVDRSFALEELPASPVSSYFMSL